MDVFKTRPPRGGRRGGREGESIDRARLPRRRGSRRSRAQTSLMVGERRLIILIRTMRRAG